MSVEQLIIIGLSVGGIALNLYWFRVPLRVSLGRFEAWRRTLRGYKEPTHIHVRGLVERVRDRFPTDENVGIEDE